MHGAAWIAVFRRMPAPLHDGLALLTATGTELIVQRVLRLERDFMVFLGRLSGSQDGGKIILLPYDQISNLVIAKKLTETEATEMFALGNSVPPPPMAYAAAYAGPAPSNGAAAMTTETALDIGPIEAPPVEKVLAAAPEEGAGEGPAASPPTPAPVAKPQHPSKSVLLARLRERLGADAK